MPYVLPNFNPHRQREISIEEQRKMLEDDEEI
jgi:hypothetical protein